MAMGEPAWLWGPPPSCWRGIRLPAGKAAVAEVLRPGRSWGCGGVGLGVGLGVF